MTITGVYILDSINLISKKVQVSSESKNKLGQIKNIHILLGLRGGIEKAKLGKSQH
jgi:hypothetical protein